MRVEQWNLPSPPGFQGLDSAKPLNVYERHLPHWRQDGATYFVTFRLADSLPQEKLNQLRMLKHAWEARSSDDRRGAQEGLTREIMRLVEAWLDQGLGSCVLSRPAIAEFVAAALHYFDGQRYELNAYVIMPNHVHALVRPLVSAEQALEEILQTWKRYTARRMNAVLGTGGSRWQEESYDRIVRDEEHLYRCVQYIGNNPSKAGLAPDACPLWIRPEWLQLGWNFESMAATTPRRTDL